MGSYERQEAAGYEKKLCGTVRSVSVHCRNISDADRIHVFSVGLAFYTSLTDKMPGRETHFIGLENYKALLSDDMFRMSFRNQAVLSLFAVFNSVFFPLLAALILYHVRHKKLSRIIKTLFVIPMLVPSIVVILIWKYLYNPNFGFNSILKLLHLGSLTQNWLNNSDTALMCIILVGFPFVSGMYFLLFHTGINSISPELMTRPAWTAQPAWTLSGMCRSPVYGRMSRSLRR